MRKKLPKSHNKCIGNCEQNPTKQLNHGGKNNVSCLFVIMKKESSLLTII